MTDAQSLSLSLKIRNVFVLAGSVLAIFTPIWWIAAALGTKFGLWPWGVGLLKMTGGIGLPLLGLLVLTTFITSLLVVFIKPRAGFGALAGMWVVAVAMGAVALSAIMAGNAAPPIHDVSTNTAQPLTFSAKVLAERGTKSNRVMTYVETAVPFDPKKLTDWSGRSLQEIQEEANPDIKTVSLPNTTPAQAYAKALATAKQQGLKIKSEDAAAMRIEAVAESFWYGFKDDVVIVVTPAPSGANVDMRSVSRVGISDLGANAKRIRAFLDAMKA